MKNISTKATTTIANIIKMYGGGRISTVNPLYPTTQSALAFCNAFLQSIIAHLAPRHLAGASAQIERIMHAGADCHFVNRDFRPDRTPQIASARIRPSAWTRRRRPLAHSVAKGFLRSSTNSVKPTMNRIRVFASVERSPRREDDLDPCHQSRTLLGCGCSMLLIGGSTSGDRSIKCVLSKIHSSASSKPRYLYQRGEVFSRSS